MGGSATLVERQSRNFRLVLSRSGAMACCRRKSAAPGGYGFPPDLLLVSQFLLFGRHLRFVVDRVDLGQQRPRYPREARCARAEDRHSSHRGLGEKWARDGGNPAIERHERVAGRRALLLRMAASSCG